MWFEIADKAPTDPPAQSSQWFKASSAPPMRPKFVQQVLYVTSEKAYYVAVDPGWLSGLAKSGRDQTEAFAKAGFGSVS